MSERIHVLAQQLFNQPTVDACSLQAVRELADRYPYFAPAQFLLLEKLKQDNDPGYTAQLQKAVLYYHNPLEFEYFISSDQFYTDLDLQEHLPTRKSIDTPEPAPEADVEYTAPKQSIDVIEETSVVQEEAPASSTDTKEETAPETLIDTNEEAVVKEEAPEPVKPEEQKSETKIEAPTPAAEAPTIPALTAAPADGGLTFEPFHTVDYFASQGIKLSQEEVTHDRFGKQVKSFTEWLKTMKRLPQQPPPGPVDSPGERNVQHLAADSVHEADVVTEAMAEVWVKQGNKARAVEVYRKLSLLNPSKNAYFAAKIDQLKSST